VPTPMHVSAAENSKGRTISEQADPKNFLIPVAKSSPPIELQLIATSIWLQLNIETRFNKLSAYFQIAPNSPGNAYFLRNEDLSNQEISTKSMSYEMF
jgi:hypothetical protein